MSMMDGDSHQYSEIDRLVAITGFSKIKIKKLAYLGHTTEQIIELSKKPENKDSD